MPRLSPSDARGLGPFAADVPKAQRGAKTAQNSLVDHHFPITRPGKNTKNDGESQFFMGKSTISMVMFNSYVKLHKVKKILELSCLHTPIWFFWGGEDVGHFYPNKLAPK